MFEIHYDFGYAMLEAFGRPMYLPQLLLILEALCLLSLV